jgi:hypothetical protein
MFCEQLDYNLLFRWFLDLNWDEPSFDHSTFSRNRGRLLEHDVAGEFFRTVVAAARELRLTSDEWISYSQHAKSLCLIKGNSETWPRLGTILNTCGAARHDCDKSVPTPTG